MFLEIRHRYWRMRGRGEGGEAAVLAGSNGRGTRVAEMGRHLSEGNTFTKKPGVGVLGWCLLILPQATFIQKPRWGAKFPPGEKLGGFAVCWRPKCEQLSMPTTQAPSSYMILNTGY